MIRPLILSALKDWCGLVVVGLLLAIAVML